MKPIMMPRSRSQMYGRSYRREKEAKAAVQARLAKIIPTAERPIADESFVTDAECKRAKELFPGDEGMAKRIAFLQRCHAQRVMASHKREAEARGLWGNRDSWAAILVTTLTMNGLKLGAILLALYAVLPPDLFYVAAQFAALWGASRLMLALITRRAA